MGNIYHLLDVDKNCAHSGNLLEQSFEFAINSKYAEIQKASASAMIEMILLIPCSLAPLASQSQWSCYHIRTLTGSMISAE